MKSSIALAMDAVIWHFQEAAFLPNRLCEPFSFPPLECESYQGTVGRATGSESNEFLFQECSFFIMLRLTLRSDRCDPEDFGRRATTLDTHKDEKQVRRYRTSDNVEIIRFDGQSAYRIAGRLERCVLPP